MSILGEVLIAVKSRPRRFVDKVEGGDARDPIWWYDNVVREMRSDAFSPAEQAVMNGCYQAAKLLRNLDPSRRGFLRRHFCETFQRAARFLLDGGKGRILDLGGGTGIQAVQLAAMGAEVHVLDMDEGALDILERRRALYETQLGRVLSIRTHCGNALTFDYASIAPLDGLHSMFAFNMMKPSVALMDRILPHLSLGARLAVLDGNSSCVVNRLQPSRRRDIWSPGVFEKELISRGFSVVAHAGGVTLPPFLWAMLPYNLLRTIDDLMNRCWFLPASHQVLAKKTVADPNQ